MNPNYSFVLSAQVVPTSTISAGQLMVSSPGTYLPATATNRALYGRSEACALTSYGGASATGFIQVQQAGTLDATLTGLGTGAQSWVRCSTAGIAERFTPVNAGTSDVIGWCETDGRVHLLFGVLTETMLVGGGGSGIPAPSSPAAGDLLIYSSGAWNRLPIGVNGQQLQVVAGLPAWVAPTIDPSTLNLSGYWKDYPGAAPWTGSASLGTSGGLQLTNGVSPSAGGTFGTHTSARGNGTTQYLVGAAINTYLSVSQWYLGVIFNALTVAAPGANPYDDGCLLSSSGSAVFWLGMSTSGLRAGHFDGTLNPTTPFVACSAAAKHYVQAWYDGSKIYIRVDGGAAQSVTAANGSSFGFALNVLRNYNAAKFLNADIAEIETATVVPTATQMDQRVNDARANYGTP